MGFLIDSGCYLRDNWNKLDFSIVFFSIIDMSLTDKNLKFIKVFFLILDYKNVKNFITIKIYF